MTAQEELTAIRAAFEPIKCWFDGDGEIPEPPLHEMIAEAVTELQRDRAELLRMKADTFKGGETNPIICPKCGGYRTHTRLHGYRCFGCEG